MNEKCWLERSSILRPGEVGYSFCEVAEYMINTCKLVGLLQHHALMIGCLGYLHLHRHITNTILIDSEDEIRVIQR
jgi:hypothetical protein